MFILLALLSCGVKSEADIAKENQSVGPNEVLAKNLNGTVPDTDIQVPDFVALNSDGEPRTQKDLLDHRTVLWFYPITGTPG